MKAGDFEIMKTAGKILLALMLLVLSLPTASAFIPERSCINSSYLRTTIEYTEDSNTTALVQRPLYCPFGCQADIGRYGADCANPPFALPLTLYLLIFGLTLACLVFGVIKQLWLPCLFASVFFMYLAFQAFMLEMNGQQFTIMPLIMLSAFAGIVSLVFTLYGVIEAYKNAKEESAVEGSIPNSDKALRKND